MKDTLVYSSKKGISRNRFILFLAVLTMLLTLLLWKKTSPANTLATYPQGVGQTATGSVLNQVMEDSINNSLANALLPVPQKVMLSSRTFSISGNWYLEKTGPQTSAAAESLTAGLKARKLPFNVQTLPVPAGREGKIIRLVVREQSVPLGMVTDSNQAKLSMQAYKIQLAGSGITISANAAPGLFYGVQTLLQLIVSQEKTGLLPEGEITDWPVLPVRMIYWDDAHHLETMPALKRIISQAAHYKINAFAIKLEGHFMYRNAPEIVEPHALTPAQYQELTDYARERFVELVPYLDAPAHVSFILKHPAYAGLRLFPDNNYQFSVTNPGTEKLLKGMFADLIQANKGGNYILLSTDEAYYTGKGGDEVEASKAMGGNGKLLADFIRRIAEDLHRQGRTVIFWGEFPIEAEDIPALPPYLVNGVYSKEIAPAYKNHGLKQFIYTATQGAEPVFPNYYPLHTKDTTLADGSDRSSGRVAEMLREISTAIKDKRSNFLGVIIAGWGDAGLHPESFWLGYATGASAGWNHHVTAADISARFYRSFYGARPTGMEKIYQRLSTQAEFFDESWVWGTSELRKPILGNSYGIFDKPQPAKDQSLPLLPVPSGPGLSINDSWDTAHAKRLQLAGNFLKENGELRALLRVNRGLALQQQAYNLEVLESIGLLCKQNLDMLLSLQRIYNALKKASATAASNPGNAVASIDTALNIAEAIKTGRNRMLAQVTATWYKEWHPLVSTANGRTFLHSVDDIKDHQPGRTTDLGYLVYRQLHYPLGKWFDEVIKARNEFAGRNNLPLRKGSLQWEKY